MNYTKEQQAANRAKWVAALRSGEYQQGREELHDPESGTHCCLGVACELAIKEGIVPGWPEGGGYEWDEELPSEVSHWLGLRFGDGMLTKNVANKSSLIGLNDDARYTFTQIADVIEDGKVRLTGGQS